MRSSAIAEHDESDIAVLGACAGIGCERSGEGCLQEFIAIAAPEKELLVSGQAGGMRQQHAEGDVGAPLVSGQKLGDSA